MNELPMFQFMDELHGPRYVHVHHVNEWLCAVVYIAMNTNLNTFMCTLHDLPGNKVDLIHASNVA